MIRRGRLEIYRDLLTVIAGGKNRTTHIMYATNLSWTTLREHLSMLYEYKLIYRVPPHTFISDKGIKALCHFGELYKLIPR